MQLRDTVNRGDQSALREIIPLCNDPTPEVRVAALEALAQVGAQTCLPRFSYHSRNSFTTQPRTLHWLLLVLVWELVS